MWYQKSREKWIKLGSHNNSFFHAQTIIRRKRNKIHGIHLPSGMWCTDPSMLKEEVVKFFKDIFCSTTERRLGGNGMIKNTLGEVERYDLIKPVTIEEVYGALMSMKSYKAPGPDGFQPIFFKMFWNEVGEDVWMFVKDAIATGNFDARVAETLLVLIPKGDHPTSFKEFRPITLCNVLYKLMSKVLVSRLRPYLDSIVSPLQSSFIPGRSTKG